MEGILQSGRRAGQLTHRNVLPTCPQEIQAGPALSHPHPSEDSTAPAWVQTLPFTAWGMLLVSPAETRVEIQ